MPLGGRTAESEEAAMVALTAQAWTAGALEPRATTPLALGEPDEEPDPLSVLDDLFQGGDPDVENRGWTWYQEATVQTQTIAGGELELESTQGSATGSWWFTAAGGARNDGNLLYKNITGAFDARIETRVRNSADTSDPPSAAGEFHFIYLQAHDPDRTGSAYNYVSVGLGGNPTSQTEITWGTTDDDGLTANATTFASTTGSSPLSYQLRIVRRDSDNDILDLYSRRTDAGFPLEHNSGWNLEQTIDRSSNSPARTAPATPIALPATLQVGISAGSCNVLGLDIRQWVERFIVRTTTD